MTSAEKKATQLRQNKLQTIMKYIAGAAVTLTTAVVSVINPMAAAEARFLSYEAAGTDLVYEAYVDASYDESGEAEIQIVARDQFGDHTQTVWAGRSSGVFTGLDPGTDYTLLIQINNGFGWNVLARETVTTDVGPGGAIVGYDLAENAPMMESGLWRYTVNLHVSDPESAFTSVTFRYATLYEYELAYLGSLSVEEYLAARFAAVDVTGRTDAAVALPDMWKQAAWLYWYLEAETAEGTVVLDSRLVVTPPVFYGYVSVADAGLDFIEVYARAHPVAGVRAAFEIVLATVDGTIIDRVDIEPVAEGNPQEGESVESEPIRFDKLLKDTEYRLELRVTYIDPETGYEFLSVISSAAATTTVVEPGGSILGYDVVEDSTAMESIRWDYTVDVLVTDPFYAYSSVTFKYASITDYERENLGTQTVEDYLASRWQYVWLTGRTDATVTLPELWREAATWYWVLEAATVEGTVVLDSRIVATPPVFSGYVYGAGAGIDYLDVYAYPFANPDIAAAFSVLLKTPEGVLIDSIAVDPVAEGGQPSPVRFDGLSPATAYLLELVATYEDPDGGGTTVSLVSRIGAATTETLPLSSGEIAGYDVVENTSYAEMIYWDYTVDIHVSDPASNYQSVFFRYASLYEFERANLGSQTVEEYLAGRWTSIDLTGYPDASVSLPEMERSPFTWYWILEADTQSGTVVLDSREIETPPFFGGTIFTVGAGSDYLDIVGLALLNLEVPAVFRLQLMTMSGEPLSQVVVEPVQQGGQPTPVRFGGLIPLTGYRLELAAVYDDPESGDPTVSVVARAVAFTTEAMPLSSGAIEDYDVVENTSYADSVFWDYTVDVHVSDPASFYRSVTFRYAHLYNDERDALGSLAIEAVLAGRWTSIDLTGSPDASVSLPEMERTPFTWYWILEADTPGGTVVLDTREIATPPVFAGSVVILETGVDYLSVAAMASANPDVTAAFVLRLLTAGGDFISEINVDPAVGGQNLTIMFDGLQPETDYRLELSAAYADPGSAPSTSVVARFRTRTEAIPAPLAAAVFLSVGAVGKDVAYEAYINAFTGVSTEAPIRIVARNPNGDLVRTAWAGRCAGVFTGLEPDTGYTLAIEIDEGYGWQVLAAAAVTTASGAAGAIVGYDFAATNMNMETGFWTYAVGLHVSDPDAIYTSVTFRYAVLYDHETWYLGQMTVEEYLAQRYASVDLAGATDLWVALPDQWMEPFTWYWRLEATTAEGTVVLASRVVDTPPVFRGFANAVDAGTASITAYASAFVNPLMPADYLLRLSTPSGDVVADIPLTPVVGGPFMPQEAVGPLPLVFEGLTAGTAYRLELLATYIDPETGFAITAVVAASEAPTMPDYTFSFTWTEFKTHIDFEASFTDPAGAIGNITYEVFVFSQGFWQYQNGTTVTLTVVGDVKTASFTVHRPANAFRICVYVEKTPSPTTNYASLLADIYREAE